VGGSERDLSISAGIKVMRAASPNLKTPGRVPGVGRIVLVTPREV
jgi:hypothetical protein